MAVSHWIRQKAKWWGNSVEVPHWKEIRKLDVLGIAYKQQQKK